MIDQTDGRMWIAHHNEFSEWVDGAVLVIRSALSRLSTWDGSTHQLVALIASFAITALSFNTTGA